MAGIVISHMQASELLMVSNKNIIETIDRFIREFAIEIILSNS